MLPLVSVLTPTYGRPELLQRAVEIFHAYSYPRKEMIVVDDSPEPASLAASPLVRYVHLERRRISGEKHNLAVQLAQGEILIHQDDDDLFSPIRLSRQVHPILAGRVSITGIVMNFIRMEATGKFYHFRPGAKFIQSNATTKPAFNFHDSTAAFHRDVWRSGLQYSATMVAQKVHFLNDAIRAGFPWEALENRGDFVYSRHDLNSWVLPKDVLIEAPAPSFSRIAWFQKLMGVAA